MKSYIPYCRLCTVLHTCQATHGRTKHKVACSADSYRVYRYDDRSSFLARCRIAGSRPGLLSLRSPLLDDDPPSFSPGTDSFVIFVCRRASIQADKARDGKLSHESMPFYSFTATDSARPRFLVPNSLTLRGLATSSETWGMPFLRRSSLLALSVSLPRALASRRAMLPIWLCACQDCE